MSLNSNNYFISKIENLLLRKFLNKLNIVKIIIDEENLYNFIYLIITLMTFQSRYVFSILLLDVIKRSEDLQNIIKSITMNTMSLLKTVFLGLIILYVFATLGFLFLNGLFKEGSVDANLYAKDLYYALTTSINIGLRNGGGLGDQLEQPDIGN